jgi:hypothetical protein
VFVATVQTNTKTQPESEWNMLDPLAAEMFLTPLACALRQNGALKSSAQAPHANRSLSMARDSYSSRFVRPHKRLRAPKHLIFADFLPQLPEIARPT